MSQEYAELFEPVALIDGLTLRNRVVMSPMTTWAGTADFQISPEEEAYYRRRVKGVGMVLTGCAQVTPNGIGFSDEFSAADDSFVPSLRRLATAAKSGGAPALLQLFHAGNKAMPHLIKNGDVVSASAIPTAPTPFMPSQTPRALATDEVTAIISAFGQATRRGIEAGFDGVELHGAHGFLMQNFLSPATNQRDDQWGGSLENRMRLPLEIIKEARGIIASHVIDRPFALGFRISPEESGEQGYRIDQTLTLVDRLIESGVDYIHVSLANLLGDRPIDDPDGAPIVARIVERVAGRVPVLAAGGILTPGQAVQALDAGLTFVAIGRGLIINPDWVETVAEGGEVETALDPAGDSDLAIPPKLWGIIESMTGWFPMKPVENYSAAANG